MGKKNGKGIGNENKGEGKGKGEGRWFEHFRSVFRSMMGYVACVMMLFYKKNHGTTQDKKNKG